MVSLTIFANFLIDTEERFLRLQDSFNSFSNIHAQKWVINVRGQYRDNVKAFLEHYLGLRVKVFQLDSPEGWFHDSRIMAEYINTEYVFFWIEDHINLVADLTQYDEILLEMHSRAVEVLPYSFLWFTRRYNNVPKDELENIYYLNLDKKAFNLVLKNDPNAYILGCLSFFEVNLFKRILFCDDKKQVIKWPKETPFNFEKSSHDIHWLPIKIGLPKYELFASIDDDSIEPGSSLISRGLYPNRVSGARITTTTGMQPCYDTKPESVYSLLRKFVRIIKKCF